MSLLNASECLQPMKSRIIDLAKIIQSGDILTRVVFQWRNRYEVLPKNNANVLELMVEVSTYTDATGENPFSDVAELTLTTLSLSHSNVKLERIFSHTDFSKSKLRNRLSIKSLNAFNGISYCYMLNINKGINKSVINNNNNNLDH